MMKSRMAGRTRRIAARGGAALLLSVALIATVWGQQAGQGAPGAPGGAPGGQGAPGGEGAPGGMPGGPGGPGGDGNIGAQAMTKAPVVSAAKLLFVDFETVKNKDAVETVFDFGLMGECKSDKGGQRFCPEKSLTLGELAKAVALSTQLVKGDTPSDYIAYCIEKGLYKGTNALDKSVTGYDAAKMLLSALGIKGINGDDRNAVTAALKERNLTKGIESINLSQAVSRDNAAQMIANALSLSDGTAFIPKVLHNSDVSLDSGTKTIDNTRIFYLGGTAVQDSGESVLVVRNSRIDGDTSEATKPLAGPPGGLLVAGSIRTTLTLGRAQSFYINSNINSKNWAALSTDGAKPATEPGQTELGLYAYGSSAKAIDGGYGTYSDLFCNVFFYGAKLTTAEIGIISGTYGRVTVGNIRDGEADNALAAHLIAADKKLQSDKDAGSVVTGGRNAVMIHSVSLPPYWVYKGYSKEELPLYSAKLSFHGSTLATDLGLNKKLDYSPEQQAYIDHHAGSVILVKSANADIDLNKAALKADKQGTGALIHTVINNDTMFMTKVPDGTTYPGVKVKMTSMKVEGDILNEDYQRDMALSLTGTSLTGKIVSGTVESWNALSKEKGFDKYIIDPSGYKSQHGVALTLDSGSVWNVTGESTLSALTIASGASVTAPDGRSLSMTVDGVETPVVAGTYKGKIALTPAKDLAIHFSEQFMTTDFKYRQGIYINNGAYLPEQSVAAAVTGGSVTNDSAKNVKIASNGERFNGIIVAGNSTYVIDNPTISLRGNGKNDFAGVGAAIRAGGTSKITVNHAKIDNTGAVRSAIWVGDNSEITINDSEIEVHDGVLPKNYGWSFVHGPDGSGTAMMEVPWMLGLIGNNRATLVTSNGIAHYNNTHIKAQAWGAISTDAIKDGKVYLTKCHVETIDSGYGAFADGQSLIHSSGTTFDVADYALILGGGTGVFTDGSVVNSRRIGVMAHGGHGGKLIIDKGSVFNTEKAVLQFKSSSPAVVVDNATLNSKSGVILQMMVNDDPNKQTGGAPGGGAPGGGAAGTAPAPGGAAPGGAMPGGPGGDGNQDLEATFKNVTLKGDFYNSLTSLSAMNLTFENATVTGAICTATAIHATGPKGEKLVMQDAPDLYYLIGDEKEICAATNDAHGASASLDAHSTWVVDKTSYLTGLTIAPGAKISAPQGGTLTMTVDGVATPIGAGAYKGKIILKVSAGI